MSANLSPPPLQTPLVDKLRLLTKVWNNYYLDRDQRIAAAARVLQSVALTGQSGALGVTPFTVGTLEAGLYLVRWYVRVTTAASTSSAVTVTVTAVDGGIACAQSGAPLTGNTTASAQSGMALVRIDRATAISYSTTYASTGGTAMTYRLDLTLDQLAS